jgi:hypothetical protein
MQGIIRKKLRKDFQAHRRFSFSFFKPQVAGHHQQTGAINEFFYKYFQGQNRRFLKNKDDIYCIFASITTPALIRKSFSGFPFCF